MKCFVGMVALCAWLSGAAYGAGNGFILPFDASVSVSASGGNGGATTEFGRGISAGTAVPIFTGLPKTAGPVSLGTFSAGSEVDFYQKSEFGCDIGFAFSADTISSASLNAFRELDSSLGLGGSIYEKL